MKSIGNKIITEEEAKEIAMNEMTKLEKKFPESIHDKLWDFHRAMKEIENKYSQRVSRYKKSLEKKK